MRNINGVRTLARVRRVLGLICLAVLGAAGGLLLTSRPAGACKCSPDAWVVRLTSVTSDTAGVTHEPFWPAEGELSSYPGHADIWALSWEPGVISRVGADR